VVQGRDPGWYPDPQGSPGNERYWDGGDWTAETRVATPRQPPGPSQPPGWYPDPGGSQKVERYWDGATWTDSYRPQKSNRNMWIAIVLAALAIIAVVFIVLYATKNSSSKHTPATTTVPHTVPGTRPPRTTAPPTTVAPTTEAPTTTATPTTTAAPTTTTAAVPST
jgi:Protein of unknown function (DUF2510)